MDLTITLAQPNRRGELFGPGDRFLRRIRDSAKVQIHSRSATIQISGDPANVARAAAAIERLQETLRKRDSIDEDDVAEALAESAEGDERESNDLITVFTRSANVNAKTDGQRHYIHALRHNDLCFCVGPAGTGKTYIAVAMAVHMLKAGEIKRIVLVRPAVEAGEKLGFLPGDLQQKVNPYLRPIFDALHDMMTYEQTKRFMLADIIEVIPLAYMRGRTLNGAAIILDEAQNTTPSQMLMFLTRMGHGSKMIVTGDDSQIDLDPEQPSGLIDAIDRLRGARGIEIVRLTEVDIVRHPIVQQVVARYGRRE